MAVHAHTWAEPDLYLMADEDLIETCENALRKLCPISKHPDPVIVPDNPWEGTSSNGEVMSLQDPLYGSVLYDPEDGDFHCWYNVYNRYTNRLYSPPITSQGYACCYAVSHDGLHWEKPPVRKVLYDGSYDNNILQFKDIATSGTSNLGEQVWNILPFSSPDSDDRYAASLYTSYDDPLYSPGITMCFSPDGLNWRMHYPPVLPLDGDCHALSWDPVGKCFLLTTRSHQHMNLSRRWGRPWKRHIALAKSRDLINWTAIKTVLEADEKDPEDTQLYLMYILPYGHAYLGQLLMFYGHEMVLETQLALSRDLENWQRLGDRQPFLARGPEDSWDSRHVALTHNIPYPDGNEMRFWYGGKNRPHYQAGYAALGTGTLRRDGFVCYEAGDQEAVLTTIPFMYKGATWLVLNATADHGEILVEVTDREGNPLDKVSRADCIPVTGDHTRVLVNFKAGPGDFFSRGNFLRFEGEIRFRFYMRNARLYAMKAPNLEPIWPEPKRL